MAQFQQSLDYNKLSDESTTKILQLNQKDPLDKIKDEIDSIFENAKQDMKQNEFKIVTNVKEQLI